MADVQMKHLLKALRTVANTYNDGGVGRPPDFQFDDLNRVVNAAEEYAKEDKDVRVPRELLERLFYTWDNDDDNDHRFPRCLAELRDLLNGGGK